MEKNYTIMEMENIFEIGRAIEAKIKAGLIDECIDSKDLFAFAIKCAVQFEKEYPDTEDYYGDIDEFIEKKLNELY